MQTYSVYFAMCHNGALRRQDVPTVEAMLRVIYDMMASGLDVAVINDIEWRDIKVWAYLLLGYTDWKAKAN